MLIRPTVYDTPGVIASHSCVPPEWGKHLPSYASGFPDEPDERYRFHAHCTSKVDKMSPMSKTIRTAVIGTGFVGRVHIEAIRRLGFVEIGAIVDVNAEQARKYADEFRINVAAADYR